MKRIALVTAREALPLDEDLPPLVEALRQLGAAVDTPCWDDTRVEWGSYDTAVLRSTWDYFDRLDEFLDWAETTAARTQLVNPPSVLRWNTDKHYLGELAAAGVPVVPSRFVEPGASPATVLEHFLSDAPDALSVGSGPTGGEFVLKPCVGGGSRDAARYRSTERKRAADHLARLLDAGRSALLQPYLNAVDEAGETALIHIDGRFSHAVRKEALLRLDGSFVAGLFAPETISARQPAPDELAVALAACGAITGPPLLYARVDVVRDPAGRPVVLELELTEPSLFFLHAPGSARRMAEAILDK